MLNAQLLTQMATGLPRLVVIGVCVGIFLAALYNAYQKSVPGGLVRALLRAEALSPESAKSPQELGLRALALLSFELEHNTMLRRFVMEVQGEDGSLRYYIPQEQKYAADTRFEQGGNPVPALIIVGVLCALLAVGLLFGLPVIEQIIDNMTNKQ